MAPISGLIPSMQTGCYRMSRKRIRYRGWRIIFIMQPHRIRRLVGPLFLGALTVTVTAWIFKGDLVGPGEIRPDLLQAPRQDEVDKESFSFEYKG